MKRIKMLKMRLRDAAAAKRAGPSRPPFRRESFNRWNPPAAKVRR